MHGSKDTLCVSVALIEGPFRYVTIKKKYSSSLVAVVRHGHKFSDTHPLGGAVCVLPFDTGALVTASATSRVWQK